jgi:hypothetical protein
VTLSQADPAEGRPDLGVDLDAFQRDGYPVVSGAVNATVTKGCRRGDLGARGAGLHRSVRGRRVQRSRGTRTPPTTRSSRDMRQARQQIRKVACAHRGGWAHAIRAPRRSASNRSVVRMRGRRHDRAGSGRPRGSTCAGAVAERSPMSGCALGTMGHRHELKVTPSATPRSRLRRPRDVAPDRVPVPSPVVRIGMWLPDQKDHSSIAPGVIITLLILLRAFVSSAWIVAYALGIATFILLALGHARRHRPSPGTSVYGRARLALVGRRVAPARHGKPMERHATDPTDPTHLHRGHTDNLSRTRPSGRTRPASTPASSAPVDLVLGRHPSPRGGREQPRNGARWRGARRSRRLTRSREAIRLGVLRNSSTDEQSGYRPAARWH